MQTLPIMHLLLQIPTDKLIDSSMEYGISMTIMVVAVIALSTAYWLERKFSQSLVDRTIVLLTKIETAYQTQGTSDAEMKQGMTEVSKEVWQMSQLIKQLLNRYDRLDDRKRKPNESNESSEYS